MSRVERLYKRQSSLDRCGPIRQRLILRPVEVHERLPLPRLPLGASLVQSQSSLNRLLCLNRLLADDQDWVERITDPTQVLLNEVTVEYADQFGIRLEALFGDRSRFIAKRKLGGWKVRVRLLALQQAEQPRYGRLS